ncbi:hypothetical protein GQ53DRAFT_753062 [Thozetella sp. PMI_491]|nr:hypothetical protein GQ53DRAFT_753062 [Thozetella sp. PMI_491]
MPVILTKNQLTVLQLINGAPFLAIEIFPSPAFPSIALISDIKLHLSPLTGILVTE